MIDELKSYSLPVTIAQLLSNRHLDFPINAYETGERNNNNQTCKFKNQIITINKARNTRKLRGSPHYFYNDGHHNYDDFSYPKLVKAICGLSITLEIDPGSTHLNGIEYGVNLITDFNPFEVLNDLIQHQGVPFYPIDLGVGMQSKHSQYRIKIYNKGLQNDLPYYVIRIEIHVNTMEY